MTIDIETNKAKGKAIMYDLHYQLMMSKSNHIPSMKGIYEMEGRFDNKLFESDKPFQIIYKEEADSEEGKVLTVDCDYPVKLFRSFLFMASDLMILLRTWHGNNIFVLTKESHKARAWTILNLGKDELINKFNRAFDFQLEGYGLTHHLMLSYETCKGNRLKMVRYGWGYEHDNTVGYCGEVNFCGRENEYFEPTDIFGPFPHPVGNSWAGYDYRYNAGCYVVLCHDDKYRILTSASNWLEYEGKILVFKRFMQTLVPNIFYFILDDGREILINFSFREEFSKILERGLDPSKFYDSNRKINPLPGLFLGRGELKKNEQVHIMSITDLIGGHKDVI